MHYSTEYFKSLNFLKTFSKEILIKKIQLPSEFNSVNEQAMLFSLVKRRYADQSTFFY